ncbi:MAG: hypothetical protein WA997_11800, partial [Anaerolineales bacterium]
NYIKPGLNHPGIRLKSYSAIKSLKKRSGAEDGGRTAPVPLASPGDSPPGSPPNETPSLSDSRPSSASALPGLSQYPSFDLDLFMQRRK